MLQCRSSIALAAVMVVLLSSKHAHAQLAAYPGFTGESGGLVNDIVSGVQYDIVNQAKAERRLQQVQARLRRDAERGDSVAVDRDARRIHNLKYRIVVDEWLIRKNSLCDPGPYPYPLCLDPMSRCAIAQASSPAQVPYLPQAAPTQYPIPTPAPTPYR